MTPSIVYEDKDLLVINKPAGLITHPKNKNDAQESVVSWLLDNYPEIKNVGEDSLRPGIVHRLDRNTSGLLIITKTQEAFYYLKKQFQDREIEKTYIALAHGKLKNDKDIIKTPLAKIGVKQTTRIHGKKKLKEKEAITEYKTIKKFNDYTLLEVYPKTGRTHQIRVHLNSIHHSIVGDTLYGKKPKVLSIPEGLKVLSKPNGVGSIKINRLFLHAFKLKFTTPSGKRLLIQADMPKELVDIISGLKNPSF